MQQKFFRLFTISVWNLAIVECSSQFLLKKGKKYLMHYCFLYCQKYKPKVLSKILDQMSLKMGVKPLQKNKLVKHLK